MHLVSKHEFLSDAPGVEAQVAHSQNLAATDACSNGERVAGGWVATQPLADPERENITSNKPTVVILVVVLVLVVLVVLAVLAVFFVNAPVDR